MTLWTEFAPPLRPTASWRNRLHEHREIGDEKMKKVTLEKLNMDDNPAEFGGMLISDDEKGQLWSFGNRFGVYKFANRSSGTWSENVSGWGIPPCLSVK